MIALPKRRWVMIVLWSALLVSVAVPGKALAEKSPAPAEETPGSADRPTASPEDRLAVEQQRIADRYQHLEEVLLRMAELNASTDPGRAALLRRVVAESKSRMVGVQFEQLVTLMSKGRLSRALENQKDLDRDLRVLLELLLSENRAKQLASEKARIRDYIKRVGRIIRKEKSLQGRTAGGGDLKRLADEQERLAEKTGDLAKDVKSHEEAARGRPSGNEAPEGDPKESESEKPSDKDHAEKSDSSPAKKSEDAQPSEGSGQGQGSSGGQSSGAQSQSNPTQKNLDAARQRMQDARKKLEKAEREGAVDDQEEAIRQLEQARAELEEILRQLREEEIERMLTLLEARFKKMLEMQQTVYKGTKRLDKVPPAERRHEHEIEASRLGRKQSLIVLEADKALLLLREDGSSVAFPEAVSQTRDDMQQVVLRLGRAKVGPITQSIEEDIIAALEEMIEAFQRAIDEQEARRGQPPPPQGQPQDPPLVDQLSELRMIRALQMRVNQRTARYSKLIEGEQAENADLLDALRRLAEYQSRIHQITRDLESGKNQ
ncbi:MAG: hypothetical protein JW888_10350 [Pirellulales bacterium]|nr:hypothetical protein [Pirellulales bacterium]